MKLEKVELEQKLKHEKKIDKKRDQTNQRTNQREVKRRPCVHYDQPNHLSTNCDNVTSVSERRKRLIQKQLCFSCTGPNHRAEECHCVTKCSHCRRRRHSSICENISFGYKKPEHMLVATGRSSVTYPVVVVKVCGIRCRALLDTGSGNASAALLGRIGKQPVRKEFRRIETLVQTTDKEIEIQTW